MHFSITIIDFDRTEAAFERTCIVLPSVSEESVSLKYSKQGIFYKLYAIIIDFAKIIFENLLESQTLVLYL